jgi:hypothetical protein
VWEETRIRNYSFREVGFKNLSTGIGSTISHGGGGMIRAQAAVAVRQEVMMFWPYKNKEQNKDTERGIRIITWTKETYGIIQNKIFQTRIGRHQDKRKEKARYQRGKTMGR